MADSGQELQRFTESFTAWLRQATEQVRQLAVLWARLPPDLAVQLREAERELGWPEVAGRGMTSDPCGGEPVRGPRQL